MNLVGERQKEGTVGKPAGDEDVQWAINSARSKGWYALNFDVHTRAYPVRHVLDCPRCSIF